MIFKVVYICGFYKPFLLVEIIVDVEVFSFEVVGFDFVVVDFSGFIVVSKGLGLSPQSTKLAKLQAKSTSSNKRTGSQDSNVQISGESHK